MIRLEPSNPDTPKEIFAYAKRHGSVVERTKQGFDEAIQGVGGYYILKSNYLESTNLVVVQIIDLTNASFASTPRVYKKNDGYDENGKKQGDGKLVYPLDDITNTTAIIGCDLPVEINRDAQLYGNIDWIGKNTSIIKGDSDAPVLTFKGPTGRTLPFDFRKSIEGYTSSDIKFSEDSPEYYTCFSPNIYRSGEILATIPTRGDVAPKVTGAALTTYKKDNIDTEVLICMVSNHYVNKIGFFDEVWVQFGGKDDEAKEIKDGWKIIYSIGSGRPSQCWFFNQSGNKCTQNNLEYIINVAEEKVEKKTYDAGIGSYSARRSNGGHDTEITHTGTYQLYSDYKGDERVTGVVELSASKTTTYSYEYTGTGREWEVFTTCPPGKNPDEPYAVVGPNVYTPGAYTSTGGYCTGGETVIEPTGRGTQNVTITNACGQTATIPVRMPDGEWVPDASYGVEGRVDAICSSSRGVCTPRPCLDGMGTECGISYTPITAMGPCSAGLQAEGDPPTGVGASGIATGYGIAFNSTYTQSDMGTFDFDCSGSIYRLVVIYKTYYSWV